MPEEQKFKSCSQVKIVSNKDMIPPTKKLDAYIKLRSLENGEYNILVFAVNIKSTYPYFPPLILFSKLNFNIKYIN